MGETGKNIPWMTTFLGHLPHGETPVIGDLINLSMPILWRLGGDKRLKTQNDGLHLIVHRSGGVADTLGSFQFRNRSVLLDAGAVRSLTLNKWRRRFIGILAHEVVHARQYFRGPLSYTKASVLEEKTEETRAWREYWMDPWEVEARHEEGLVRRALGLPAGIKDNKANRLRVEEYKEAFGEHILPLLRELEKFDDNGGRPPIGLPMSRRQIVEQLDDMTNYMSVRTIRSWDSRKQALAARWWLMARGTGVNEVLEKRTAAGKGAWLGSGMVQRGIRAELERRLPVAAEKLKVEMPTLTPMRVKDSWDVSGDDWGLIAAGLSKLQTRVERGQEDSC